MTVQTEITAADRAREQSEEERLARAVKKRGEDMAAAMQTGDSMEIFKSLLGFLFEFIFGTDEDAPNEGPGDDAPVSRTDQIRTARAVIDSKALPKWEAFKREHSGKEVMHRSPVDGAAQITSDFGPRRAPKAGASTNHKGLDFGARDSDRTPDILASADGVVLFAGRKQGYGNTVVIGHADGTTTLYGHLTGDNMPQIGAQVRQGEVIGEMGNTGNSTAVHLHYEQRRDNVAYRPRINGQEIAVGSRINGQQVAAADHDHHDGDGHDHDTPAKPAKAASPKKPFSPEVKKAALAAVSKKDDKPETKSTLNNGKWEFADATEIASSAFTKATSAIGSLFRA